MEIRATLLGIDLDFQLGVALASRPACAGRQGGYLYFYIIICPRLRSAVGTIGLRVIHNWAQLQSSASFSSFRCPSPAPAMEPIRRSYFTINRRDREFMGVGDPIEMHACPERCGQRLGHGLVGRPGVVQGIADGSCSIVVHGHGASVGPDSPDTHGHLGNVLVAEKGQPLRTGFRELQEN